METIDRYDKLVRDGSGAAPTLPGGALPAAGASCSPASQPSQLSAQSAPPLRLKPAGAWMRAQWPFLVESWQAADGKIIPWLAGPRGMDFDAWLADVEKMRTAPPEGWMPSTLYGLVEAAPDGCETLLGFLDLRHRLNDSLMLVGGHIGYGLHPAARGRGLASAMLRLGLAEAAKMGIEKALLTCNKENHASAATIRRCGGVLENEVTEADGAVALRFWLPTGGA